jgi:predicted nucleic acid-binding protein
VNSFFDTSVLVAACVEGHEHHTRSLALFTGADRQTACCAAHTLAELYATLTRLPGSLRMSADQALLFLDSVEERLEIVALDVREYRQAIREAASAGIIGGTIYDALLGWCALKARATRIYTWDVADFQRLAPEIAVKVRTP